MAKETYSIRISPDIKKDAIKRDTEYIEKVLELSLSYLSDDNIKIALLEQDIRTLKEQNEKLTSDLNYYQKQVDLLKKDIETNNNFIKEKNEALRELHDLKINIDKELKHMFNKILELIKTDSFNEFEVNTIIKNREYATKKLIIEYAIHKINISDLDNKMDLTDILKNC